jgi:hypothetical protein
MLRVRHRTRQQRPRGSRGCFLWLPSLASRGTEWGGAFLSQLVSFRFGGKGTWRPAVQQQMEVKPGVENTTVVGEVAVTPVAFCTQPP